MRFAGEGDSRGPKFPTQDESLPTRVCHSRTTTTAAASPPTMTRSAGEIMSAVRPHRPPAESISPSPPATYTPVPSPPKMTRSAGEVKPYAHLRLLPLQEESLSPSAQDLPTPAPSPPAMMRFAGRQLPWPNSPPTKQTVHHVAPATATRFHHL